MKALIAASSVQAERVQKAPRASRRVLKARLPSARRACDADRNAATKNAGRYLHDLTRKRVIETKGMYAPGLL
jgi:Ni/Co efflux regulator RcnB